MSSMLPNLKRDDNGMSRFQVLSNAKIVVESDQKLSMIAEEP